MPRNHVFVQPLVEQVLCEPTPRQPGAQSFQQQRVSINFLSTLFRSQVEKPDPRAEAASQPASCVHVWCLVCVLLYRLAKTAAPPKRAPMATAAVGTAPAPSVEDWAASLAELTASSTEVERLARAEESSEARLPEAVESSEAMEDWRAPASEVMEAMASETEDLALAMGVEAAEAALEASERAPLMAVEASERTPLMAVEASEMMPPTAVEASEMMLPAEEMPSPIPPPISVSMLPRVSPMEPSELWAKATAGKAMRRVENFMFAVWVCVCSREGWYVVKV